MLPVYATFLIPVLAVPLLPRDSWQFVRVVLEGYYYC